MRPSHANAATRQRLATWAAAGLLVTALVWGGGSRGLGDTVVHWLSLPVLVLGLLRWRHAESTRLQRLFLYWVMAVLAVLSLQLLPLPASVWSGLGRRGVLADLHAAGMDPDWLPLTLDRWGTTRALLAVTTFAAMWLLASTLDAAARIRMFKLAVITAVPLVLLGYLQAGAGHTPSLRFHAFHNSFGATATFANRNHFASLLAMLVPFTVAFGIAAQRQRLTTPTLAWHAASVALLLAAALTFSRAGVMLATLAVVAGVALALRLGERDPRQSRLGMGTPLLLTSLIATGAIANYAWRGIADRLDLDPMADLRWQYLEHGISAAKAWLPWGAGAGSFRAVYAPFEPVQAMVNRHALHAHNDVLEVLVETGIAGGLLIALFIGLFLAALGKIRLVPKPAQATLAAAALAAAVPLLHSLGDYPLRTLAVAALLAVVMAHLMAVGAQDPSPVRGTP